MFCDQQAVYANAVPCACWLCCDCPVQRTWSKVRMCGASAYLTRLGNMRNRLYVMMNWTMSLIFGRDVSRW